jgi:hypothetical protein
MQGLKTISNLVLKIWSTQLIVIGKVSSCRVDIGWIGWTGWTKDELGGLDVQATFNH